MLVRKYIHYIHYAAKRPFFIGAVICLLLLSSFPIFRIHIDSSGEGWLPKDSKRLALKNQFIQDFGNDELMMLYLAFPDTSSPAYRMYVLQKVNETVGFSIHSFENVFSKFNLSRVGELMGKSYLKKLEQSYFNSKDSTGEMVFLKVRSNKNINGVRPFIIDSLHSLLNKVLPKNITAHLSGQGVIFNEIDRLSSKDSGKLFAICFSIIFLLLWWQLRKLNYLLLCLVLIALSVIPALSLFGWLNIPINMITMTVPLLFLVNFSSFTIHFITKQSHSTARYINKKLPPVIASTLTTIIGFGSLTTSNINLISEFGVLTSLGILWGLLILLAIGVPLVLRLITINELVINSSRLNRFLDKYYLKLSRVISIRLLVFMAILITAGIFVFPEIKTDTNAINFMKPDNEVRKTVEYIEKHFGGANVIDYIILKDDNTVIDETDEKIITQANKNLAGLSFVRSVIGFDLWRPFVHRINSVDSVLAKRLTRDFFSGDKHHSRIIVNIPSGSVKEMDGMIRSMQEKIDETLKGSHILIKPAGFLPLYIEQMSTIVDGMLYGLGIAVLLILAVMTVLVRNIRLGLMAIAVTVFPLSGVALLMKLLNIPFDVGTSIISSVSIGMIADDALHIMWNYRINLKYNRPNDKPVNIFFADSIRAIVFPCTATSLMFSLGFMVLLLSKMITIFDFGVLCTATIVLAWISDFIFFPALLIVFRIKNATRTNWFG